MGFPEVDVIFNFLALHAVLAAGLVGEGVAEVLPAVGLAVVGLAVGSEDTGAEHSKFSVIKVFPFVFPKFTVAITLSFFHGR